MNRNDSQHIDPELDQILKKNDPRKNYEVPENYFDQLPDQIMARINESDLSPGKLRNPKMIKIVRYGIGIAASVSILIAAIFLLNRDTIQVDPLFAELEFDEQYNFLFSEPDDLSFFDITEFTGEESITDIETEIYSIIPDDLVDDVEFEDLELFYE